MASSDITAGQLKNSVSATTRLESAFYSRHFYLLATKSGPPSGRPLFFRSDFTAANTASGISSITAYHSRGGADIEVVKNFAIPAKDTGVLVDKKLILETDDILKIEGTGNSELEVLLSVLETAKQ